jgi:hypothetical protein
MSAAAAAPAVNPKAFPLANAQLTNQVSYQLEELPSS